MHEWLFLINQSAFYLCIIASVLILLLYRKEAAGMFRGIERRTLLVLVIILALSFTLRVSLYPDCDRWLLGEVYIDYTKGSIPYGVPMFLLYRGIGFFYMLGAFFALAGPSYSSLFMFNLLAGCSLVVSVFFLSYLIFGNEKVSLIASFLFSFSPAFVIISMSCSYTLLAILFSSVALAFLFMFFRTERFPFYAAGLLMALCTIQIRPDYIVFAFVFLVTCIIYRKCFKDRKVLYFTAVLLAVNLYLIYTVYIYFLIVFSYDYYFTGVPLDRGNLLLSLFMNSLRILHENSLMNVTSFFRYSSLTLISPVLAAAGAYCLFRKRRRELYFLLSCFAIFFLSYIVFHSEGFFSSGLKYIPSPLLSLFILASFGAYSIYSRVEGGRAFLIVILVAAAGLSVYQVYNHNLDAARDPRFQEYAYLKGNLTGVNTSCGVIYTGSPTLFKNAFGFGYDRYIEINDTKSLEEFVSDNATGCFYAYSGYYDELEDETERIVRLEDGILLSRLSEGFEIEEIINASIDEGRVLLYYFENP